MPRRRYDQDDDRDGSHVTRDDDSDGSIIGIIIIIIIIIIIDLPGWMPMKGRLTGSTPYCGWPSLPGGGCGGGGQKRGR
jgi:hypothetical protein